MTHYVAIDIGGTNIKYGLIDQEVNLLNRMKCQPRRIGVDLISYKKTKDIVASYIEKAQ